MDDPLSKKVEELDHAFEIILVIITIVSGFFADSAYSNFSTNQAPISFLIRFLVFPVIIMVFGWLLKTTTRKGSNWEYYYRLFCWIWGFSFLVFWLFLLSIIGSYYDPWKREISPSATVGSLTLWFTLAGLSIYLFRYIHRTYKTVVKRTISRDRVKLVLIWFTFLIFFGWIIYTMYV